ncbi:MAG: hypothetical protein AAB795_03300 [Patescibacteria group bacterium]
MASLDDLKKRIYRPDETFKERLQEPSIVRTDKPKYPSWKTGVPLAQSFKKSRRFYWILGTVTLIILISALIFILVAPPVFFKTQVVDIKIQGSSEIQSGERVSWTVEIVNRTNTSLDSASIVFNFPSGAMSVGDQPKSIIREKRELGAMVSGQSITQIFDAYVFGGRDQQRSVSALVEYRPKGSSSALVKTTDFTFVIARSPIALSIDMPNDLRAGQKVSIKVRYISQSDQLISNLGITVTFPDGFELVQTMPDFEKNGNKEKIFWKIGNLAPSASGFIDIEGIVRGQDLDSKSFNAIIGIIDAKTNSIGQIFDETILAAVLHSPFLDVVLDAPPFVGAGKGGIVKIKWKNNLPVEVRDPILEIMPSGDALDLFSLQPSQGSFKESYMIWNSSTYSPFRIIPPGGSGETSFSFNTKSNLARISEVARPIIKFNAIFRSTGQIAGLEGIDINGSSSVEIKVSTRFSFTVRGAYFNSPITNIGSLPPKVGSETTYTIIWSFANMSNDVNNVVVRAALPPYIKFKNIINPSNANIRYDENSGFIVWNVGKVLAGTGFLRPALQAAFQIGFTPLPIQIGQSPDLISKSETTGTDSFTNESFTLNGNIVKTEMSDDHGVTNEQKKVVQ